MGMTLFPAAFCKAGMAADKAFRASSVFLLSTAYRTFLAWVFKADLIETLRSLFFSLCRALFRAEA